MCMYECLDVNVFYVYACMSVTVCRCKYMYVQLCIIILVHMGSHAYLACMCIDNDKYLWAQLPFAI